MTTAAPEVASRNGAAISSHDGFPVDSFRDAAIHLRRPFTPAAVKFKVQATWQGGALIVAYIDARLVVERLNLVCPHLWFDEYVPVDGGRLLCRLTLDGITRHDIGDGYQGKGLYSDAFKRAAVKFGIGVSLYATPQTFLSETQGHIKPKKVNGKDSYVMTPSAGEKACRARYAAWLEEVGTGAFGEPLDHGDVEDSQGDAEVPEPIAEPSPAPAEAATPATIAKAAAKKLVDDAWRLGVQDKLQLAIAHIRGDDLGACNTKSAATDVVAQLTVPEGERLATWLLRKGEEAEAQS